MLIADSNRGPVAAMVRLFCGVDSVGSLSTKLWRSFGHCDRSGNSKYGHCHFRIAVCAATTGGWSDNDCKPTRNYTINHFVYLCKLFLYSWPKIFIFHFLPFQMPVSVAIFTPFPLIAFYICLTCREWWVDIEEKKIYHHFAMIQVHTRFECMT